MRYEAAHSYEDALAKAANENGIDREYWDIFHRRHEPSLEVRRKILASLGRDVQSLEAIERDRSRAFQQKAASVLEKTIVITSRDLSVSLSHPADQELTLDFELVLEGGGTVNGTNSRPHLEAIGWNEKDGTRWTTYRLPLPPEVPLGYHTLTVQIHGGPSARANLIVCPENAYLPEWLAHGGRTAGFNISLYGLRSERNWGCGDFTDLRALIHWATREVGFSFIGLNPLHALHNRVPYNTSPYLPVSIYYKNLIYIDLERVPEFSASRCAQQVLASPKFQCKLRDLRGSQFVAYSDVDHVKKRFLKILYREFRRQRVQNADRGRAFDRYCETEGDLLHKFALYCALDEVLHKQDRNRWTWQQWPEQFHSPTSEACGDFAAQHWRLIEYYKYIQFVLEEQLNETQSYAKAQGLSIGLYHDLAVATDSCGSDLWAHREFYVEGCRVGAPPDDFSPNGQDWAFPPPNALKHWEDGYRLYRESIRKVVRSGGALRIDHVMRLFRLFWIPEGFSAAEGIYVRDNARDLMRILALESVRSQNIIIGEDLGTVTDEIRDTLAQFSILSYRLFYFEKNRQDGSFKKSYEYPRQALVASSTHDLPTIAGFWQFRDIEARKQAGLVDDSGYWAQREDRGREKQFMLDVLHGENLLPDDYPRNADLIPEIDGHLHDAVVAYLAQVPSMILLLNQEDFTKETEQQNLPGSTAQYPNWQRKMNVSVEELFSDPWRAYSAMFRHHMIRTGRISVPA
ncbi:MAG: 4-alpha-glucanotransferase [Bryobacteraceae bacterium]